MSEIKLYVRMPKRIKDEHEIKLLHPAIQNVILPRQKSAKFCHITFEDLETCKSVKEKLKTMKINGKGIKVMKALPKPQNPLRNRRKKLKTFTIDTKGSKEDSNKSKKKIKFNANKSQTNEESKKKLPKNKASKQNNRYFS